MCEIATIEGRMVARQRIQVCMQLLRCDLSKQPQAFDVFEAIKLQTFLKYLAIDPLGV